jgi:hypothetical protein
VVIRILTILGVLAAFSAAAFAREECSGPLRDINEPSFKLATVTAKKAFFHDDDEKPRKSFVVKGDELLVGEVESGFACAAYIGRNGIETDGLIKSGDIKVRDYVPPRLSDWLGDWNVGKWQNLTLRKGSKLGWIKVSGEAYWAANEEAALNGGLNQGEVEGEAPLENGLIGFTQTDDNSFKPWSEGAKDNFECAILVRVISRHYLMAEDSGNCGGHNVRFTGTYVRGKVEFE